ncbi:hypothetical protein RUM43_010355 [Polyplax serrata]|uniref:Regulator of G-protein signaling 7 n=1 Tax=Polyplax serrata TaxID=468196 RepID=A0AAN8P094_POLSC
MSSEKTGSRRKPDPAGNKTGRRLSPTNITDSSSSEDSPNHLVYKKMEQIVERMQDENSGVPVKTVKSFMSKIPSVFSGADLILWMTKNLDVDDQVEGLHLAHLMASHGYFFPIEDHALTVKNDNSFYRFQTPYFWPSNCWEPENTDYAVYLCKRTMQNKTRLELADYEAENLARLQKMFSRKWEFIFMQAEAQSKVDKKRDKLERKVLDSQERAFWDVHRPMPGCVNTTESDIKKVCRKINKAESSQTSVESLKNQVTFLKSRLERRNFKVSKIAEAHINYYEQYSEYDPFFIAPELSNPWISDCPEMWEQEKNIKELSARRVKRWTFSLKELLQDPAGRDHFLSFLGKEFSGENLKFWEAVQEFRTLPQKKVASRASEIWAEYLAPEASSQVNIDCRSYNSTKKKLEEPDRWSFDPAAAHLYDLMKQDTYQRYIRSDYYKDFLNGTKKKTSVKGIRSIVSFSARKDVPTC